VFLTFLCLPKEKVTKERVAGKTKSSTFFTQGRPALSKVLDFTPFLRLPPTVRRLINNSLSRIEVILTLIWDKGNHVSPLGL
jgi:hypothetical protein